MPGKYSLPTDRFFIRWWKIFDEGGGAGSGYCPHGYPEGQCPYYGVAPGSSAAAACSTIDNRLHYDSDNYTFRDDANYNQLALDVTQVRPNDGQHLNETIA